MRQSKKRIEAPPERPSRLPWLLLGLLVIATLIAYHPALHGAPVWDDDAHLTRAEMRSVEGLRRIWFEIGATQQYYPVVHSAFWLMQRAWGLDTFGYHIVNVLLHLLSAVLVFVVLSRLGVPGAPLSAAIFALHPVHVESVAWMTELKNTLSGVFCLGAALVYLRYDATRKRGAYALALVLFVLALLSKTVTATLPAALLVVFWWKRGAIEWRRDVVPLLPFFAGGIAAGLGTAWVERTYIGAQGFEFDLSPLERVLLACRALWFYAGKLAWPWRLTFIYPRWNIDAGAPWQWLFPLAAAGAIVALWLYRRRSRAPLAAVLLFAGTLFPALGFFNVFPFRYSFVADHFQYLASIPLIALACAALAICLPRAHASIGCAAALVLGVITWQQSTQYVDAETLYRETLARNPSCWLCHNNLAAMRMAEGRVDAALPHLQEGLRLYPRNAEALNNLGYVLRVQGKYEEAVRAHEESLLLSPNAAATLNNLGVALQALGRRDEALARYESARRLDPGMPEVHHNIGRVLQELGRAADALPAIDTALRLRPDYADAYDNRGSALLYLNRPHEALAAFQQALALNPGDPRLRRKVGVVSMRIGEQHLDAGRPAAAVTWFEGALEHADFIDAAQVHNDLGIALAMSGDRVRAIQQFREALRIRPDFPQARANLARAER